MKKNMVQGDKAYKSSINFISDACLNIKTVLSLGHEEEMLKLYDETLEVPLKLARSKSIQGGMASGVFFLMIFVLYGLILFFGSRLLKDNKITVERLAMCMFSLIFSMFGFAALAFTWPN